MDFTKASHAFQEYLKDYDQNNDKVRLKSYILWCGKAGRRSVPPEKIWIRKQRHLPDHCPSPRYRTILSSLKRFDSFEPATMDHAAYGVQILF